MTVHVTQCSMTAQVRQRLTWKMSILPHLWTPDTHEVTRGWPPAAEEFAFFTSQFWASDTHEVTKRVVRRLGKPQNLQFTTVLSFRHARSSDVRVARRASEFEFYHSFERPTRTKWRKGCSDMWKICILPQFWTSDTHEVTRELSNPQVRSLRPDRKRIYFKTFSEGFD